MTSKYSAVSIKVDKADLENSKRKYERVDNYENSEKGRLEAENNRKKQEEKDRVEYEKRQHANTGGYKKRSNKKRSNKKRSNKKRSNKKR
jgi:hypothetical protein